MINNIFDETYLFINRGTSSENFKKGKNWSYDLKVGDEYFISGNDIPIKLTDENEYIVIKPGQFAVLETKEEVSLPNDHIGLISVKFSFKKRGLINVSGFHVDPLYEGKIIFTVFNAGPNDVYIKRDEYVFMIFFMKLKNPLEKEEKTDGYHSIPKDIVEGLGGGSLTLMENNKRIDQLEFYMKVIVIPIALMLIGFLFKQLFGHA